MAFIFNNIYAPSIPAFRQDLAHRGNLWSRPASREAPFQANRMEGIYVQNDSAARQRVEEEAIQGAALGIDPREFGFTPGIDILVVDLSRVKRPDMLKEISATLQKCRTCGEVRWLPQKPLVSINTAMKESEIQYLLNGTRFPFEFVWSHAQSQWPLASERTGGGFRSRSRR